MKHLLYIFLILAFSNKTFAGDNKNGGKENTKTIIIKLIDNTGEELAGAKIKIAETGKEYVADFNGTIQIQCNTNENVTLKIASLGFEEKIIKSSELSTFNDFTLSPLH